MTARPYNVLFIGRGNAARSILAESILRQEGDGRFCTFSAGTRPKGAVHPIALRVLTAAGYPATGFRSKHWDEFSGGDAPLMDFVITLCDDAAAENCPAWHGQPVTAHWGIADPAAVQGSDDTQERAFKAAFRGMKTRVSLFAALRISTLALATLTADVRDIGTSAEGERAARRQVLTRIVGR